MFATSLSPDQLLALWCELEDCHTDSNSFGGTVAEIYAFTLWPYSSYIHTPGSIADETRDEFSIAAGSALAAVLTEFCQRRQCTATIDGEPFKGQCAPFLHRVHVAIIA